MGFHGIEPIQSFKGKSLRTSPETRLTDDQWWLKVRTGYALEKHFFKPISAIAFMCWPGNTEPSCFGLCRYEPSKTMSRSQLKAAERRGLFSGFHWQSFCKTQYASSPQRGGIKHFLAAHTRLVRLLDYSQSLGLHVDVQDDSGFWDHRDKKKLEAEVQSWNQLTAAVIGRINNGLEAQGAGRGIAPITEFPDFERLEAEGQKFVE